MKLFGKTILLKKRSCSVDGTPGVRLLPEVNLYVRVTNGCNACCKFCSNYANAGRSVSFNRAKLLRVLDELEENGIAINRLSITGGEPGTVRGLVEDVLSDLSDGHYRDVPVTLATNGLSDDSRALIRHRRWNEVCLSVHHYDYARMAEAYGLDIKVERFDFSDLPFGKVAFSCNLIKGLIDSPHEMLRMMEFAHENRIKSLGFVELMPVNDFCRAHLVKIDNLDLEGLNHLIKDCENKRDGVCRCRNYLHSKGGETLSVYVRAMLNPQYCESSLLYDGENLRQGFHSDNVII